MARNAVFSFASVGVMAFGTVLTTDAATAAGTAVVELTQIACQFSESENAIDRAFCHDQEGRLRGDQRRHERRRMAADGVALFENTGLHSVARSGNAIAMVIETDGGQRRIEGSHLLVAVGSKPNVNDLDHAGFDFSEKGITVDVRSRTTNKRVFVIDDVTGGYQFTHMTNNHAGIVIRNALFRLPAKVDHRAVPRVTHTEPELAHVGMSEEEAEAARRDIRVLRHPFSESDRARTGDDTGG